MDLKKMNLIKLKNVDKVNHKGMPKNLFVINDYHALITNPGYSRNYNGNWLK